MTGDSELSARQRAAAELRARIVGTSLEHDQEDVLYWQTASEQERGRTLYGLLQFAQNVLDSTPVRPEEPLTFPGFPKSRDLTPSSE